MTPVGAWNTIDDKTGEVKSEVVIVDTNGVLSGKVNKVLSKTAKPDALCDACTDERKGKPLLGLEIIRGLKKTEGEDLWEAGQILDPESGKTYTLRVRPLEDGKKLQVRGYIGPFYRTQVWVRAQ
ncbi:DUF2147 domain-containing protein [Curvibacter sp. CHRR-16]|uniref:DUF2147 domain-containing protein n=1 Tax=Curvibacter sp. CHRR-16 TaxID=2835872 RepID=UPI002023A06E|nr:DUF2147 domain-containing protein [Curvibacter sp. CHRR-16]